MSSSSEIFSALSSLGFENNGSVCYGSWKGYPVSMQQFAAKIFYITVAVKNEKYPLSLQKSLRKAVKEKGRPMEGVERFAKRAVVFSVSFSKARDVPERFAERMDAITAALRDNGISPADTCALSGSSAPDSLCLIAANGVLSYQPVCGSVVRNQNYETREQVESNELSGNYATGFVGALLGMLVGLIPNLLTIIFLERVSAIVFMLVPLCAFFGYKLFRGRMSKGSLVIVILLCLVGVLLIPYLEVVFYLVHDEGIALGEALSFTAGYLTDPNVLTDPDIASSLRSELLQLVLFMALGIFLAWKIMSRRTNGRMISDSQAQLDSLRRSPNRQDSDTGDGCN